MANALAPWLLIVAIVYFIFQYFMIVRGEEEFLAEKFGEEYKTYYANVPMFIPRVTGWKSNLQEDQTAEFNRGFKSERRTLQAFSIVGLIIIVLWMLRS